MKGRKLAAGGNMSFAVSAKITAKQLALSLIEVVRKGNVAYPARARCDARRAAARLAVRSGWLAPPGIRARRPPAAGRFVDAPTADALVRSRPGEDRIYD
jgi:hypothetical protein